MSGLMVNMKDSQLEKELKDKHGEDIMEAQSSFCIKRTRKVLPTAATNVLRKWWKAHFAWPYPTVRSCLSIVFARFIARHSICNTWAPVPCSVRSWKPTQALASHYCARMLACTP